MAVVASAGNVVNLWDLQDKTHKLIRTQEPVKGCPILVSDVVWSQDGKIFASAVEEKGVVTLEDVQGKTTELTSGKMPELAGAKRLCFTNTNSNLLAIGSRTGKALLWDTRFHRPRKEIVVDESCSVSGVAFNTRDTTLIASTSKGEISMFGMVTGQRTGVMNKSHQAVKSVMCLRMSRVALHLLGTTSEEGDVSLWDWATAQHLHTWEDVHKAPATCLVFSPLNSTLLITTGLDQNLCCFDIQMRQKIKCFPVGSSLMSIDMLQDGITLAVGTTKGQVITYDLRQSSSPLQTFEAHPTSVTVLRTQPTLPRRKSRGSTSSAASKGKRLQKLSQRADAILHESMASIDSGEMDDDVFPQEVKAAPNQSTPAEDTNSPLSGRNSLEGFISPLHGSHGSSRSSLRFNSYLQYLDSPDEMLEVTGEPGVEKVQQQDHRDVNDNPTETARTDAKEVLKPVSKATTPDPQPPVLVNGQVTLHNGISSELVQPSRDELDAADAHPQPDINPAPVNSLYQPQLSRIEDDLYELRKLLFSFRVVDTKNYLQLQEDYEVLQQTNVALLQEVRALRSEIRQIRKDSNHRFFDENL